MKKKTYSQINLFLRSLVFSIYSLVTICLYSLLIVLAIPFSLSFRHKLIRAYLRSYMVMLKLICHIDYRLHGAENIPVAGNAVVLSKHQSTWETFFLPTIFHEPAVILKKELFLIPFFGWALAASRPIAIDRNNKSSAMQQVIAKGKTYLEAGRFVLVFPEGTRVPYGQVGYYKLGGARLAVATGAPIIPVAHDAGRFWPRRKFIKHPGTINVVIGAPIETKGKSAEEALALTKQWIEDTMTRMRD